MALVNFWISYRIHNNSTYNERYEALREAIEDASTMEWKETTSFHVITSNLDVDQLAKKLKAAIDVNFDRVVIRQLNVKVARYAGKFDDEAGLLFFMDYAKRI